MRKKVPQGIRRPIRAVRAAFRQPVMPAAPPAELWRDCRVCASREELIGLLPRNGRVAEIGTDTGSFARQILKTAEPRELHVIDIDLSRLDHAVATDKRVTVHRGDSATILAGFSDASFDWIYVDGDHSLAGVARDAEAAASKLRPGGFLIFNDFAHLDLDLGVYGVHTAVIEFATRRRWPIAWMAYAPNALYDIALRRPSPNLNSQPAAPA